MRVLLVEPNYKNKYPPMGLMKISTYHKILGDEVRFVKGFDNSVDDEVWDRIYITTLTGEIKIISTNPDELSKINVGGIDQIYKSIRLEDTQNLLLYTNLGLEVISYPDKYYHLDDIKESLTKIVSTKNKLIIGNSRGDFFVYDFVKGKNKILTKLKDSKITDIIRLENNSLVISNDKGQIIILG